MILCIGDENCMKYTLTDGTKRRIRDGNEINGFDCMDSLASRKSSSGLLLESANFGDGMIWVVGSNSGQQEGRIATIFHCKTATSNVEKILFVI